MNGFRLSTLQEALALAMSKTFVREERRWGGDGLESPSIVAIFDDGTEIAWESQYEGPYSEVTPGNGIEPPNVWIKHGKATA